MSDSFDHALHSIMVRDLPGMAANLCRAMREFPVDCAVRDPSGGLQAFDTHWIEVIGNHVLPSGAPSMDTMLKAFQAYFTMAGFLSKYSDNVVAGKPAPSTEDAKMLKDAFLRAFDAFGEGSTYAQAGYTFDQTSVNALYRDDIDLDKQDTGYDFYDLCRWLATKDYTGATWVINSSYKHPSWDTTSLSVIGEIKYNFDRLVDLMYNGVLPVFLDITHRIRDIAAIVKSDDDTPEWLDRAPWGIDTSKSGWFKLGNITNPCVSFRLSDNARYQLLIKLPMIEDLKDDVGKIVRHVILEHIDLGYIGSDSMFHGSELNTSCADNSDDQTTYNILSDFFPISDTANTIVLKFADTGNTALFSDGAVCTTDGKYANSNHTGTYAFRPEWVEVYVRKVGKSVDKTIHASAFVTEDANDRKFTGAAVDPLAMHTLTGPTVAPLTSVTFSGFRTTDLIRPQTFYGTIYDGFDYKKHMLTLDTIKLSGLRFDVHYPCAGYKAGLKIRAKYPYVVMAVQMRMFDGSWKNIDNTVDASGKSDVITGSKFISPLTDRGLDPSIIDSDLSKPMYVNLSTCVNAAWPIRVLVAHIGDKFLVTKQKLVTVGDELHAPTHDTTLGEFTETEIMTLANIIKLYSKKETFHVRKSETDFDVVTSNPFVYESVDNTALVSSTAKYAAEDLAAVVFDELVWIKNKSV